VHDIKEFAKQVKEAGAAKGSGVFTSGGACGFLGASRFSRGACGVSLNEQSWPRGARPGLASRGYRGEPRSSHRKWLPADLHGMVKYARAPAVLPGRADFPEGADPQGD
jgi:hypothetical protein